MFNLFIQWFLPHPIILFAASFLFTMFSSLWVKMLLKGFSRSLWPMAAFGAINGVIAVVVELFVDEPFPAAMMLFVPVMCVIEFRLISRDSFWAYLFILASFLINFGVIHDLTVGVMGLFPGIGIWPKATLEYRISIFTLALLIATSMQILLKRFMMAKELFTLIHTPSKSLMLVLYMSICGVALLITATITAPILFNDGLAREVLRPVLMDLVIKDFVLLACSYVIVLLQCQSERASEMVSKTAGELMREKGYRSTIQCRSLLSYCFNATANRMLEGLEYFNLPDRIYPPDDYGQVLTAFVKNCVHPDDQDLILSKDAYLFMREHARERYNIQAIRMRISLKRFIEVTRNANLEGYDLDHLPEWTWFESRATLIQDAATGDTLVYIDLVDISELVAQEEKLASTRFDAVTGIYSRAALEESIRACLAAKGAGGTMFILDMDNFKKVNDSFGHIRGDALLKEVSEEIKSVFRPGDIVGRLGGDEFCVFAVGLRGRKAISEKAQSLLAATRHTYIDERGECFETGMSVGIAQFPKDGTDYLALYENSDSALYRAKLTGKNTYCFFGE